MVTGGGGFLAAYLIKSLIRASELHSLEMRVVCVVRITEKANRRLAGYIGRDDLSIIEQDVSKPLPESFPSADFVIHAASQASPKYYGSDPVGTLLANSSGTVHMLDHAKRCKAERFLFFSSAEVYGTPLQDGSPLSETDYGYLDPMEVRSCYAESKRIGETMCSAWSHQYGLHASVVRPFHTYGPGLALDDGRVFADFVAAVVEKRDISLQSDGMAQRAFCYIADATAAFLTVLLTGEKATAYNVGNPDAEISIRNLATLVANLFPERRIGTFFSEPKSGTYLKSPVMRACPSIQKIRQLGWYPTTGLEDGFRRTIQAYL